MITKKITIFTKIKQNKNEKEKRKKKEDIPVHPMQKSLEPHEEKVWMWDRGIDKHLKKKKKKNDFSQFPPVS
jgi:hypothetical protein